MAKEEKYYLIRTNDKGLSDIQVMNETDINKFLKEMTEDQNPQEVQDQFLIPGKRGLDLAYESDSYVLIKGIVIKPKAVEQITKLEV